MLQLLIFFFLSHVKELWEANMKKWSKYSIFHTMLYIFLTLCNILFPHKCQIEIVCEHFHFTPTIHAGMLWANLYHRLIQFLLFLLVATFFDDEVGSEEGWRGPRQLTRSDRFSWDKQGLHVNHNMLCILRTVPGLWSFMVLFHPHLYIKELILG